MFILVAYMVNQKCYWEDKYVHQYHKSSNYSAALILVPFLHYITFSFHIYSNRSELFKVHVVLVNWNKIHVVPLLF